MIFRQLFDSVPAPTPTCSPAARGGEALIIDPVLEKVDRYLQLMQRARPQAGQGGRHPSARRPHHRPRRAARPHPLHHRDGRADQGRRGVDAARRRRQARPSRASRSTCSTRPATPTIPTASSCRDRVFTGDTLLIRGTGRTDFQNGDAARAIRVDLRQAAASCRTRRWSFRRTTTKATPSPPSARRSATIRACRSSRSTSTSTLMSNLKLPNPKMMDVAVPANMQVGLAQEEIARRGWAVTRGAGAWRWSAGRTSR